MNVERTIEFLLQQTAKADARIAQNERTQARLDRRVDALANIVKGGMKLFVKMGDEERRYRVQARQETQELRRLQAETERKLQRFLGRAKQRPRRQRAPLT